MENLQATELQAEQLADQIDEMEEMEEEEEARIDVPTQVLLPALQAVQIKARQLSYKHLDLVWYEQSTRISETHPEAMKKRQYLRHKYPRETARLDSSKDNQDVRHWNQGFHEGMLAASRLFLGLSAHKEEDCDVFQDDHQDDSMEEEDPDETTMRANDLKRIERVRQTALDEFASVYE